MPGCPQVFSMQETIPCIECLDIFHVWDANPCAPPREDAEFCRRIGEAGADVLQEIYDRTDGWKLRSVVKGKGKWKLQTFGFLTKALGPTQETVWENQDADWRSPFLGHKRG